MSCVNYWNICTKCKNEAYDRDKVSKCEKCGGQNESIMEWDEEPDYDDREEDSYDK